MEIKLAGLKLKVKKMNIKVICSSVSSMHSGVANLSAN